MPLPQEMMIFTEAKLPVCLMSVTGCGDLTAKDWGTTWSCCRCQTSAAKPSQAWVLGIGSASLPCSKSNIRLNDVLFVPSTTKKLLSVKRLVEDNQVDVLFTNTGCTVKDLVTGRILMQGQPRQGMYPVVTEGRVQAQSCATKFMSSNEPEFFNGITS